jgi:hypothetical protein
LKELEDASQGTMSIGSKEELHDEDGEEDEEEE